MIEIKFIWVCRNLHFNEINRVELTDTMLLNRSYPSWIKSSNCEVIAKIMPTGLHDKNGKEGYFDDLVRWGGSVYQVVWNEVEGITQLIKCSGLEVFATLPIKEMERGEIIGDIYSNPELLEVKCKE